MSFSVIFKPKAIKDVSAIPLAEREKVIRRIEAMKNGLVGDIKKLTKYTPEYRLRVGDFRILFEIEDGDVIIYRIINRRDAYKKRR